MIPRKITAETVKAAVRRAANGEEYDQTDPQCPGLQLRVRGGSVTWSVRCRLQKKQKRWIIGNPDTPPALARDRAGEVKSWCRRNQNPEPLITQFLTGVSVAYQLRTGHLPSWTWEHAVEKFMAYLKEFRARATYDDYAKTLGGAQLRDPSKNHSHVPELKRFMKRDVCTITREDIAECIADTCKRKYSVGVHLKTVISTFWTFLGDDQRRQSTSVPAGLLARLKTPDKPRKHGRESTVIDISRLFANDDEDKRRDVPTALEMGRAIAIAQSGGMKEAAALAVMLLAGSVQRRRAVIGSHMSDFYEIGGQSNEDAGLVWCIPPYMRKRADHRRADMPHNVVMIGFGADAARQLETLSLRRLEEQEARHVDHLIKYPGYFFPVRVKPGKETKNPYADPSFINHALQYMPGVKMSCHAWRRGFASYGQGDLRLSLSEIKLILDHSEGAPPDDVTANSYALDPRLKEKREIMVRWIAWLSEQMQQAIEEDDMLLDAEAVGKAIFRARYGDDAYYKRLVRSEERNIEFIEYPFAGKKNKIRKSISAF